MEHGMRTKVIKNILRKKVDDWLASIDDEALRTRVKDKVIVTGGAIASMLLGEEPNDFDVYLRDKETLLALAKYYINRFEPQKKKGIDVPLRVQEDEGRIKIVVQSAGIASEAGTEKPYEYFEGAPDVNAEAYVGDIIDNLEAIEDKHEEIEEKALATKGKDKKGGTNYRPVFVTTNSITLSDKLQIVLRFFGEPNEIHENYDFVHCTSYWASWEGELGGGDLVLRPAALESLLARELRYVGSKYPVCSLVRIRKFMGRGWRINAGQILKIAMQISELNLKDPKVLEDQLTGVDTAYFVQLLDRLKEKDPEKIDSAYLVEIVDRIF